MGLIRKLTKDEPKPSSSSSSTLREDLLFTTMLIVGLPVEVHIKDGSIYSGIFHTASFDKGYGIALKKARLIKQGTCNTNVPDGGLINTLVILSGDLVQVVAKDVMRRGDCFSSVAAYDDGDTVSGTIDSFQSCENGDLGSKLVNLERQAPVGSPSEEKDGRFHHSESLKEVQAHGSNMSLNGDTQPSLHKENHAAMPSRESPSANNAALDIKVMNQYHDSQSQEPLQMKSVASEVPASVKAHCDASRGSLAITSERSPQNPPVNRSAKESKLNPGAKVFSPSIPSFRSTPHLAPTVPSMAYVPNSVPAVQVAAAPPEVAIRPIAPRSSWPVKFVPFVNSTPVNADNSLQYRQPIAGHMATRAQTIRHGAQYQQIQAVPPPPYVHPNPQSGMFGRPNQVVYVHPVTHDVIQGPPPLSQTPHPFLNSNLIHVAKHEAAGVFAAQPMQASVTPPLIASVPQPFAMPSHIQIPQPMFSSMRPFPVLGSNVQYGAKFP